MPLSLYPFCAFTNHAKKETTAMDWLKVSQIAGELQVTGACVYGWIKEGKIRSVRLGKLHRIDREELNKFLTRRAGGEARTKAESR